jgi:hypothetical protein
VAISAGSAGAAGAEVKAALCASADDCMRAIVAAEEVQHGYQQHGQRLAEVDERPRAG